MSGEFLTDCRFAVRRHKNLLHKIVECAKINPIFGVLKGGIQMLISAGQAVSSGFVIGLGLGMVFVGLACIIGLCYLLGAVIKLIGIGDKEQKPKSAPPSPAPAAPVAENISGNKELMAAISAVIAEQMGKDISAIRIKSVKKL